MLFIMFSNGILIDGGTMDRLSPHTERCDVIINVVTRLSISQISVRADSVQTSRPAVSASQKIYEYYRVATSIFVRT